MTRRFLTALLGAGLACGMGGPTAPRVRAEGVNPFSPPPTPPEQEEKRRFRELRYDEDWTFLRASLKQLAWWDPFKYIPLDDAGYSYLTLGGEIRERYEFYNHPLTLSPATDRDGYLVHRYLLFGDLHVGPVFRVFGQVQSSLVDWQSSPARSTDEDQLDLHQLFADVKLPLGTGSGDHLTLRLGRQEMAYGAQRLVSVRDWSNNRRAFDALRVLTRVGDWSVDAFVARPVETDRGMFNDYGDGHADFWGVYATGPVPLVKGMNADAYYLGLDRPDARFAQGAADVQRHSVGGRLFGAPAPWDYDLESTLQWGRFGEDRILAYSAAGDVGYTLRDVLFTPRLGLRAQVSSGDGDPHDGKLGTYDPLFPKAGYFGNSALLGPGNLADIQPSVKLRLPHRVTLTAGWDVFWRTSTGDGIYDESGNVLRPAGTSGRFVGHQGSIGLEWEVPRHITFSVSYAHLFAGDFLRHGVYGDDVDFVSVGFRYRF